MAKGQQRSNREAKKPKKKKIKVIAAASGRASLPAYPTVHSETTLGALPRY